MAFQGRRMFAARDGLGRPSYKEPPLMISTHSRLASIFVLAAIVSAGFAEEPKEGSAKKEAKERALFDGRTLDDWQITNFGGEGEVYVEDGQLILSSGSPLTGVTYKGK